MIGTKIPKFRRFVLQNFPFIEQDFDALTDYELICKVVEYLNMVINQTNNLTEATSGLLEAFDSLKSFVDNYFDNLDVQEEINNKLNQMAEDGQLADIISQYLNSVALFGYDNIASMKSAENLINGSYAHTLGYYAKNDGGAGLYKIRTITNDDVVDEGKIIAMDDNTLIAELIIKNGEVNARQFGAKGDGVTDDTTELQNALNSGYNVYLPSGNYLVSETLNMPFNITLRGDKRTKSILKSTIVNDYTIKYGTSYDYNAYSGIIENIRIESPNDAVDKPYGIYLFSGATIRNCSFYSISRAIYRTNSYIDQLTIDNIYMGYCIPNGAYIMDLSGNADGLRINQLKIAQYADDATEYNGIIISGSHGGEITNSILNCNIVLNNLSGFSVNNCHNEGTNSYISVKDSYISFDNLFKYKNDYTASTDFVLTTTSSNDGLNIILNNCVFAKNAANYEVAFANEFNAIPNNCTLNINNVCRLINTADAGSTSHITTGIFITDNTEFNNLSGTYSKHSVVTKNKVIASPYYNVRGTSTSLGTISKFSYEKWKAGSESNLYYKILTLCDEGRKVITSYSSEGSVSNITENGDGVAIAMNKDLFANDLLLYRGTATGSYTSYAHVPAYARLRLIDNGLCVDGCAWNTTTATNALSDYNTVRKYVKIDNNVIVYNNTTPTLGTWVEGDVVINTNRNSGQTISWVYNGSNWIAQGSYA